MLSDSLDVRGVLGRMDSCISTEESLCYPAEIIIALLIDYTPIQNKKFFLKSAAFWNFPGGPVVKTPCSPRRGHRFDPCSGN